MTLRPSDAVMDLLRQGKRHDALELYSQQGANREDISRLSAPVAEISSPDRRSFRWAIPDDPQEVAQSTDTSPPAAHGCARIAYALMSGLCFLIAFYVLVSGSGGETVPIVVLATLGSFFLICCVQMGRHPAIALGLLSSLCLLTALFLFGLFFGLNKPCPPNTTGNDYSGAVNYFCGGQWSFWEIAPIVVLAASGAFFVSRCVQSMRHRS
jgi:hypothetical protein